MSVFRLAAEHTNFANQSFRQRGKSIRLFFPEDDLTATSSNKKPKIMQSYLQIASLSSLTFKVMNVKYALFLIPLLSPPLSLIFKVVI